MAIEPGTLLEATTASGSLVRMRAIGQPVRGHDFPVVWVCTEQEYEAAQAAEVDPADMDGIPWPLDAVRELASNLADSVPQPRRSAVSDVNSPGNQPAEGVSSLK